MFGPQSFCSGTLLRPLDLLSKDRASVFVLAYFSDKKDFHLPAIAADLTDEIKEDVTQLQQISSDCSRSD